MTSVNELKEYLENPILLSKPIKGETLYLYLAISLAAVSTTLVREDLGTHRPVYYASHAYQGAGSRYTKLEKTTLALVTTARRLRHYFQGHTIAVYTNQPLRQILHKPDASGRLCKWSIELSEFDITYLPRGAVKGQALADSSQS